MVNIRVIFVFLFFLLILAWGKGYGQTDSIRSRIKDTSLLSRTDSLQAVIVTPDLRPHLRKDTVEYNTAHIKMNVNADVEEMIGRLPGLQVDQDGNITYNGQKIQRVLVDGQELFGPDLTAITRNLDADMIAKVQVLDSRSKQTQFTGIDDGQRTKTLNLILKDDSKKGYFVKSEAGGDPGGYYQVSGIMGSFQDRQQIMALGLAGNNGNTGFNGSTGGLGTGLYLEGGTNDPLGASAGMGIPQTIGGAAHYANDWGANDDHADGYYQYGHLLTFPYSNSLTEQILPDSIYTQEGQSHSVNSQTQQAFDSHFNYNSDNRSAFEFTLGGGNMHGHNQFGSTGTSTFNDTLVNSSLNTLTSDVANQNFYGTIMWRVLGRRNSSRIFSVITNISGQSNHTGGYVYSIDHFFQFNGSLQSVDTTDQRKAIINGSATFDSYLNYTEPLWTNIILGISYGLSMNNTHSQQSTYNKGDGVYTDLVDSLSDHYQDIFLTQRGSLTLQGKGKEFDYVVGGDLLQYNYREQDLLSDSTIKYQYLSFAPRAVVNFNPDPTKGYSFSYTGTTQLPSFTQLQPVENNDNPLAITVGNPTLRPSFTHAFGVGFHSARSIQMNLGINFSITENGISTKTYTDSLGRQISQAVNTSGAENGSLYFSLNKRLMPLELDFGFNSNVSYARSINYVDTFLSRNDNYTIGGGFSLAKYVANLYHFQINTNFSYSNSSSSINSGTAVGYWTQTHTAQLGFFPFKNWEINTNCNYTWRQKTSVFDNNNTVMLWNSFVARNFMDNHLTARFQVNNILDANAGIVRSITANQVSQTNSNVIGRYWMLSLQYRFTHKVRSR